jgi:hypothetical protein
VKTKRRSYNNTDEEMEAWWQDCKPLKCKCFAACSALNTPIRYWYGLHRTSRSIWIDESFPTSDIQGVTNNGH